MDLVLLLLAIGATCFATSLIASYLTTRLLTERTNRS